MIEKKDGEPISEEEKEEAPADLNVNVGEDVGTDEAIG